MAKRLVKILTALILSGAVNVPVYAAPLPDGQALRIARKKMPDISF